MTKSATAQTARQGCGARLPVFGRGMRNDTLNREAFRASQSTSAGELRRGNREGSADRCCSSGWFISRIATRNAETGALTAGQQKAKSGLPSGENQGDESAARAGGAARRRVIRRPMEHRLRGSRSLERWETLSLRNGDFERSLRGWFFKTEAVYPSRQ